MIEIKQAKIKDASVLALLGRVTYTESHGHFIYDNNDLTQYLNKAFSLSRAKQEISDANNLIFLVCIKGIPAGYAKFVINEMDKTNEISRSCRLERIYILSEFIKAKIGQTLLDFVVQKAIALNRENMWLTVYIKNERAIRFYQKNGFKLRGELDFDVNGKPYKNFIFSKKLVS